jgi:aspartyl-tRNA(Asn)/glutamyl-tRNA(Gln) amidotransferase subunit A
MPTTSDSPFATIRELGRRLRGGQTTPTQLAELYLERLETVGRRFNAVVTVTRDRALREAALAEAELKAGHDRGPLHGIPYGAKDLLATAHIPTTWGAVPYRDQVFDEDATVVKRLSAAGAVLVAKLGMVELAGGMGYEQPNASITGPGLNPWNPAAWSGGSSSGSGSAVAAGAVPFAIGSETHGSITTPASYCGITGLRPTYGRVSRHGAMALSWTMDKLGPMCRSADDCGLVLDAIAGPDFDDPSAADRPYRYGPGVERDGGFRFGLLKGATEGAQPEVAANFEASLEVLRGLGTVEEVELPEFPYQEVARIVICAEAASAFDDLISSGRIAELTAPECRVKPYAYAAIPAKEYLNALRIRRRMAPALDALCARFDALVSLTTSNVAPPSDKPFGRDAPRPGPPIGGAGNLAGLPAVTIPNGFGERGLPTAIQFVGRAFEENRLLAVARAVQTRTDWHTRHPDL